MEIVGREIALIGLHKFLRGSSNKILYLWYLLLCWCIVFNFVLKISICCK